MIVLITYRKRGQLLVSHGVDSETLQNVVLPQETPQALGATFNADVDEWVIAS